MATRLKSNVVKFRQVRREGHSARRSRLPQLLAALAVPVTLAAAGIVGVLYVLTHSAWPADVTARHWLAAPNCFAARSVGLAPARRGEPGYYPSHDADNDGVACEPWPRQSLPVVVRMR
ncbi:excalibur calcium-binding domain-containing protein [Devosia sp.]|uniref:excalibur calcium-binding domain-containing protein n=1 Tax=Devosia sp. TaxID=1871048 RepID=UPI002EEC07A7